jgi:cytidylate kinase
VPAADHEFVVTIDGPAASGKSSTAKRVAERLGIHHADSGALYRAATVARLRQGDSVEHWSAESVLEVAAGVTMKRRGASFEVLLDGVPVGSELHESAVTACVSVVAKMQTVRAWVNEQMRRVARDGPIVVDGRDMGTAVFPKAQLKVFLVAEASVRARRRLLQRLGRAPDDREIVAEAEELARRDLKDAEQTQQARDAVVIDTTRLAQDEQVERIVTMAARAMKERSEGRPRA